MPPLRSIVVSCIVVVALAVAGCSSSSKTSSSSASTTATTATSTTGGTPTSYPAGKEQVCQARDQLKTSVGALTTPSLLTQGTTAIKAAVDKVQTDLGTVKTAAGQDYQPEVNAVQTSLQQLQTAVGNLGSGNTVDNLKALGTSIASVGTTTSALFTKLQAACGS